MKATVKHLATGTFIAFLLLIGYAKAEATEAKASNHENIVETALQLEKWMTDETIWNTASVNITAFAQETEAALELEDWMTNAEIWNLNYSIRLETEPDLELEDWMINETTWNTENMEKESELAVEPWMLDENFWK